MALTNKELIGHDNTKGYETINIITNTPDGNQILTDWELNENSEITVSLLLDDDSLSKMVANDDARDIELYFRCRYIDENNQPEIAEFPDESWNYLKVKPKPVVEPIIFVHASKEHLLPAIYSSADGSPWYISAFKNAMYTIKIDGLMKPYELAGKKELTFFEKKAYNIAIRNLEKKNFFTTIKKGSTSEYYYYDISEIDNRFEKEIKRAVNLSAEASTDVPRGLNAIEYESRKGAAKIIKTVGEVAGLFGVLSDLAALLRGVADHKIPPPSIIPPFITMEVNRMKAENDEFIIETWNKLLKKAIDEDIESVRKVINSDINKTYGLEFKLIDISEELLIKILKREISEYDKKSLDFETYLMNESKGKKDSSILIQSTEEKDKYNRLTINHYIHALYIQDLKI